MTRDEAVEAIAVVLEQRTEETERRSHNSYLRQANLLLTLAEGQDAGEGVPTINRGEFYDGNAGQFKCSKENNQ